MKLSDLEADSQLTVPRDAGAQIKQMAQMYPIGFRFIVDCLAGKDRMVYRPVEGTDVALMMAWLDGRRFVGLQLERIVAIPIDDPPEPLPPARTTTEKVRRREARQPEG